MLPWADAQAMQMHLDEISRHVARKAHAVVLMDRAGWHTTGKLKVPKNLTIILLPSRAPELNPVENIWQYLRANWLSNRVFEDYNAIVDAGCEAWNKLVAQPETITSNLPFEEWTETFGTERLTGALLDRLTHHVNILEMNGESYRLNQSRSRMKSRKQ